ncbi:hypothetical protein FIBSPDRAFT_955389 [Athelia psychrophila]|uniref:Uncharacterized protein n=1 Tax=Athelia psychrophila TaxID=1759441 RepID=A0A166I3P3_9AGAM|nr:hypothetical protein FIBSPDRAFT_955389 [Fibularhizoctonia sp. CBS 109695]
MTRIEWTRGPRLGRMVAVAAGGRRGAGGALLRVERVRDARPPAPPAGQHAEREALGLEALGAVPPLQAGAEVFARRDFHLDALPELRLEQRAKHVLAQLAAQRPELLFLREEPHQAQILIPLAGTSVQYTQTSYINHYYHTNHNHDYSYQG